MTPLKELLLTVAGVENCFEEFITMKKNAVTEMNVSENIVKLKIWYSKWLMRNDVPFDSVMGRHLDLYQHTSLDVGDWRTRKERRENDPRWSDILRELRNLLDDFTGHPGFDCTVELEQRCFDCLSPWLVEPSAELERDSPYGCFTYNRMRGKDEVVSLHFMNAYAPDSPFKRKDALIDALLRLVHNAETEIPDMKIIQMHSWLAILPVFAALFPESWIENAKPLGPDSGNGCWGQFVDKTGGFNHRNADTLRKTGQFPFPYTRCFCGKDILKRHLEKQEKSL